ncbi:MAG TPA: protein translocase subunit SecD [Gaiellaceae bacterium]|nr:protein translocase subunit SecD [Gaiellaceae bacterium]
MRERRNYLLLMGAITAALVGAAMLAIPGSPIYQKPILGLDLRGGLEVILRASPNKGQTLSTQGMQTAQQIIEKRANATGVAAPSVAIQGNDEIVIQLAGVHDPAKAAKAVGTTGQLQIFDFEPDLASPTVSGNQQPAPFPSLYKLLTTLKGEAKSGKPQGYFLFKTVTKHVTKTIKGKKVKTTKTFHSLVQGDLPYGARSKKQLLLPYKNGKQPADTQVLALPANREAVSCQGAANCIGAGRSGTSQTGKYWYLFKLSSSKTHPIPEITGDQLNESAIAADVDQNTGQPIVTLQFNSEGAKQFAAITKAEYKRGRQNAALVPGALSPTYANIPQLAGHNAIVLDGVLKETPYIDYTSNQLSEGIVGGNAQITEPSATAAKNTAFILKSGSLPYTFKQIASTEVTASLGKSSLHQAILAAAAGLIIVALFLLLLYRFLGLVAVLGLAIYGLLYYAAILIFNVTLTLPGFAGLILTIGVAADANVVVFERIKEEVRAGRSVRAAISAGYGKGFHTILDANVVTVITAMVIFLIAVADVKGFALMLLIGTVISLITAVAATRAMLGLLSGFRWFDNPHFMGAHGQQTAKWLQIDFMRRRYLWFALSGVVILAGMVSLGVRGLNLGIDFKGGTQFTFTTSQGYTQGAVASFMAKQGLPDAVVQGEGHAVDNKLKKWQIRTKSLSRAEQANLQTKLRSDLGASGGGVQSVSGTFGHQIAIDAIYGIVVSLLLITIYIAVRFDFKFAMPVILAMLHDIAVTVGVYALVGKEVSVATVAAVLTVLGYSIYDTIIIFDRIRENIPLMRRSPFATIANVSLWETIRRSLATTFITLLPIICLEILGGATLKDFAIALIVGVTSGAYSSIFFAAPLLTIMKEREPDYARRKAQAATAGAAEDGRGRSVGAVAESGTAALVASEAALAAEPTPELVDVVTAAPSESAAQDRRERRRQRRRSRPHGRTR